MKDVAILTKYYKNYNYGGMLQGYALHRVVLELGYSVDIISYNVAKNPNSVYPSVLVQARQYGLKAAISKASEMVIGKGNYFIKDILTNRIVKFDKFMSDTNANTEVYNDNNIRMLTTRYKTFVSGSDQVWNPNAVRNLFLQVFEASPERKISYAASIGRNSLSQFEVDNMIPALKKFGAVSVREKTARELLEHYLEVPISVVLDPTMLLSADEWADVATPRAISDKYVLVYFFSDSIKIRQKCQAFC